MSNKQVIARVLVPVGVFLLFIILMIVATGPNIPEFKPVSVQVPPIQQPVEQRRYPSGTSSKYPFGGLTEEEDHAYGVKWIELRQAAVKACIDHGGIPIVEVDPGPPVLKECQSK